MLIVCQTRSGSCSCVKTHGNRECDHVWEGRGRRGRRGKRFRGHGRRRGGRHGLFDRREPSSSLIVPDQAPHLMHGGPYTPKWKKITISVFDTVATGCSRRFDRCKARWVWTSICVWTRSVFSPRQLLEGQYSVWSVTHEMVRLEEGYVFTIGCRRGTILT